MPPPPAEQFAARIFMGPALRAQPDRRLVDLVRDGYDAAFEEIVRRYRKQLDRFAAGIVGGRSEDVTQDSFSKALLALRGSEAEIQLRPWLYRIVRNTALNDLRDRAPVAEELSDGLPGARSAAAEVEAREDLRDLMQRLQALPEPQRAALVMRELEGLSHEEIAAALGVSGGAARQAIYRARAALREGFGFLPLPALRLFAEHGAEMAKAGAATVLIAGTVGAGVAIDRHRGERSGPEAADAAPLVAGKKPGGAAAASSSESTSASGASNGNDSGGNGSTGGRNNLTSGPLGSGTPSASDSGPSAGTGSGGPDGSGDGPRHSGSGGPGPSSGSEDGSDSGSGDHHGGSSGGDGGTSGEDGGGSGGSSGDDGMVSGGDGSSGSGGGELDSEPTGSEPTLTESSESNDGGGSGDSGGESSGGSDGSGSGDLTSTTRSGSDGSP